MSTIVVITLIVLFSDQTASGILKPLVARMRPSNPDNPISPMVHVVQGYRGGRIEQISPAIRAPVNVHPVRILFSVLFIDSILCLY